MILPPSPILLRGLFLCCHHGQRQWPRSWGIEVILLRFASRPSLPLPSLNAAPKTDADFLLAGHLQLTWADNRRHTAASAKLRKSQAWYEHANPLRDDDRSLDVLAFIKGERLRPEEPRGPLPGRAYRSWGVAGFMGLLLKTPRYD